MTATSAQFRADHEFGFLDRTTFSPQLFHPSLVSNEGADTMLRAIHAELRRSRSFTFSTAFITSSAVALLKQAMVDFPGRGTIITSTYLGFNSPAALRELLNLPNVDVYILVEQQTGFHAKGYVFEQEHSTTAIIGSSNLTETALLVNCEWNLRFSALPDGDIVDQLRNAIASQVARSVRLTHAWIEEYAKTWVAPARQNSRTDELSPSTAATIQPNAMQTEALEEIRKVRDAGERRAVVISATGTGKTILAALDVRVSSPERMLFVVHRDQILNRAMREFQRVLGAPAHEFGKLVGARREIDRKYVFATVQSLSRAENLAAIPPGHFDYVLIDEVHRAGAATYRRVLDHLTPLFLLGLTATPERTDDFNVFELFDFNVPYEIRLKQALEEGMLAPFHYYGVTDFEQDGKVIDDASQLSTLVAPERADHVVRAIETYGHVGVATRGLVFCSRKTEARELSSMLNERQVHGRLLRSRALTGDDSIETREEVVRQLEAGLLDYIVTVDVFNEGIDIPSVNQVIMLRQTQSSIVFTQQLGRGLRKAAGKDHLVVIDFIGNYASNYLIPIALFGDHSLNKDSIRRNIIDAQEAGSISGLSSVNFDRISRERVLSSLAASTLDSIHSLKRSVAELENRLGRAPMLIDFARFDTADPVVVACKRGNYWNLLAALKRIDHAPTAQESGWLAFLSNEILNGKRPHELLLLQALAAADEIDEEAYCRLLAAQNCVADDATIRSVVRVLTLDFFTTAERTKYGDPLITATTGRIKLNPAIVDTLRQDSTFAAHFRDAIDTGLYLARHKYAWSGTLEVGERYSRKDACRLLNWERNEQSTMYGYKVDYTSQTCPIFVTYHKPDGVSASTAYGDRFLNESALHWFTRSRRTLGSTEVRAIVGNEIPLHLFAKKDDAEGTDFYYLGKAHASDARQTRMPGNDGTQLDVVTMTLGMESPLEASLYDYLAAPATTS